MKNSIFEKFPAFKNAHFEKWPRDFQTLWCTMSRVLIVFWMQVACYEGPLIFFCLFSGSTNPLRLSDHIFDFYELGNSAECGCRKMHRIEKLTNKHRDWKKEEYKDKKYKWPDNISNKEWINYPKCIEKRSFRKRLIHLLSHPLYLWIRDWNFETFFAESHKKIWNCKNETKIGESSSSRKKSKWLFSKFFPKNAAVWNFLS